MKMLLLLLRNMKIKTKLLIVYFLTMALTVATIYAVSATKINQVLLSQASDDLSSSTLQIRDNIINLLTSCEKATDNIVFNQTFISNISYQADTRLAEYDKTKEARDILSLLKDTDPAISDIQVYMFEDTVMFDGKTFIKYDEGDPPADMDTWITWTGRHKNAKGTSVVNLNRIIFNYPLSSKKLGILSVEIPESKFNEFIKKESLNKSILILNKEGEIVTNSSDPLMVRTKERLMEQISANTQGQFEFDDGGIDYMTFYTKAHNGWVIASYTPITSLLSTTIGINRYVGIVIALSILAFLGVATILLNLLTKRIRELAHATHRVGEGQYDFALGITGKDEIGQLADRFNSMIRKLDVLFNEVYVAQIRQKEAELLALQAQINPHFLYNVLSSLGFAALKKNAPEIRDTLNDLADFYRFSLSKRSNLVPLEEEIAQVKTYMSIQRMRFGDMIVISYDIPNELLDVKILKLTIQPFVENAIHHAVLDSETPLTIEIAARREQDHVRIEIVDDGAGIPPDILAQIQKKIDSGVEEKNYGIQNVHNRIRLYFGDRYGISIESVYGKGSTVIISLPVDN